MTSIWRDGSLYNVLECTREHNERFEWLKIRAIWSHLGPMPLWHRDEKIFYTAHTPRKV